MIMSLFKKRRYYFTDSSFASDTIIADCMGGIALIIEVVSVIVSIATAGHVPENFVGRAPQQVEEFIANVLKPTKFSNPDAVEQHASLSV